MSGRTQAQHPKRKSKTLPRRYFEFVQISLREAVGARAGSLLVVNTSDQAQHISPMWNRSVEASLAREFCEHLLLGGMKPYDKNVSRITWTKVCASDTTHDAEASSTGSPL